MDTQGEIVETDSNGRYVRFDELLGAGAAKTVYKAIDRDNGIEVAWNAMKLDRTTVNFEKLYSEVVFLKNLNHPNIIEFYDAWVDEKRAQLVFITECMSHDLGKFVRKAKSVKLKVIKAWSKQILEGIMYLHSLTPPIIHRDIKCDNIFINGTRGTIKIGDLGLATVKKNKTYYSVIGTPEYMAPEFYDEKYNEKVDIWAFGLCVLEMVTLEYPYSECDNAAQIFKKVSSGNLPGALARIKDEEVKAFVEWCLCRDPERRPTAKQIQSSPFLSEEGINDEKSQQPVEIYEKTNSDDEQSAPVSSDSNFAHQFELTAISPMGLQKHSVPDGTQHTFYDNPSIFDLPKLAVDESIPPDITSPKEENMTPPEEDEDRAEVLLVDNTKGKAMTFSLKLHVKGGSWKELAFEFDVDNDTPEVVAKEMATSFELSDNFEREIAERIKKKVHESIAALSSTKSDENSLEEGSETDKPTVSDTSRDEVNNDETGYGRELVYINMKLLQQKQDREQSESEDRHTDTLRALKETHARQLIELEALIEADRKALKEKHEQDKRNAKNHNACIDDAISRGVSPQDNCKAPDSLDSMMMRSLTDFSLEKEKEDFIRNEKPKRSATIEPLVIKKDNRQFKSGSARKGARGNSGISPRGTLPVVSESFVTGKSSMETSTHGGRGLLEAGNGLVSRMSASTPDLPSFYSPGDHLRRATDNAIFTEIPDILTGSPRK